MPIVIVCTNTGCGRKLRIQDHFLGTRMRCPHCRTMFDAPAKAPEEEEPPPRPAKRRPAQDEGVTAWPRRRPPAAEDEEQEEESSPPAKRRPARDEGVTEKPRRRPPAAEDEREEEESPRPAKRRPAQDEEAVDEPRRRPKGKKEEPEEESPRKRRRKRKGRKEGGALSGYAEQGWRKVSWGLFFCILSMWLWIGEFVLVGLALVSIGAFGIMLAGSGGEGGEGGGLAALGTLAGLGVGLLLLFALVNAAQLVGNILNIVGQCYCGACPSDEGSLQTTAILTFSLTAASAVVTLIGQAVVLITSGWEAGIWALLPVGGGGGWFGTIAGLLSFIAEIMWFKLLRGIALEGRNEGLYNQINLYLVSCLGLVCVTCLCLPCSAFLVPTMDPRHGGVIMLVILCLFPLVLVGLTAWYVIILYKVKACAVRLANRAARAAARGD